MEYLATSSVADNTTMVHFVRKALIFLHSLYTVPGMFSDVELFCRVLVGGVQFKMVAIL